VACVNNIKVILLVWVVAFDSIGCDLLGNIREYDGRGGVSTGTGVERISVCAWLNGVMVQ
jgi:hypothetical protein